MKRLVIAGAGAFGREVHEWATHCRENGRWWKIGGFLDDDSAALAGYAGLPPLLGTIRDYQPVPGDLLVCALGNPAAKRRVVTSLLARGARFTTLVHANAVIGRDVRLGQGCIICPDVTLTCDIRVGNFVTINVGSSVGHNTFLGDWTTLSGHCDVTGYAHLEEEVFMGSHASILPGVRVGKSAVVGAGSIAVINVPAGATLAPRPSLRLD